jgi:uncharacterized membrane protein
MREYKLSQEFFTQMKKRILIFAVPFMILAAVVGLWISGSWIAREGDKSYLTSPVFFTVVVLIIIVLIFSIRRSLRQQQQLWSSYRLITDENSIKRTQGGIPDITITNNEITKITEVSELGLTVYTSIASRRLGIPKTLENYSEFRLELTKRHVIDSAPRVYTKWLPVLSASMGLLTLAALAITFLATNRYVIATTGILLTVVLLLSLVSIQRNINTTKQVKRSSWFVLLPLLGIVARVFYAIAGW